MKFGKIKDIVGYEGTADKEVLVSIANTDDPRDMSAWTGHVTGVTVTDEEILITGHMEAKERILRR